MSSTRKLLTSFVVLTVLLFAFTQTRCAQGITLSSATQDVDRSKQVVVIAGSTMFGVTNPDIDLDAVLNVFKEGVNQVSNAEKKAGLDRIPAELHREPIKKVGFASMDELTSFLSRPAQNENMTLVCYLKLHGRTEVDRNQTKHMMALDDDKTEVTREYVMKILEQKKARLTVLITDSCAKGPAPIVPVAPQADVIFPVGLFADLFLNAKGVVNLNSATYKDADGVIHNQLAWMDEKGCAVFTRAFADAFRLRPGREVQKMLTDIDINKNGRYAWKEFRDYLAVQSDLNFQHLKKSVLDIPNVDDVVGPQTLRLLRPQFRQFPQVFGPLPTEPK